MSRRHEIGVGCLVVVAVGILGFMALQIGAIRSVGTTIDVDVHFQDAAGLAEGAAVSIAGVQVGRVESLRVEGSAAVAALSVDKTAAVRNDVVARVRARSVLGEKYVELSPVSADAPLLEDGATLVAPGRTVEIDQLVTQLGPLVSALDPDTFKVIGEALKEDPERAKRMLDDAERLLHNAAVASDALPEIADRAKSTLASVERTSDEARPVLRRVDGTVASAERTLGKADRVIDSVDAEAIDAMVTDLRAAAREGRVVLEKVNAQTGKVERLLEKAESFTREDWLRITQEEGVLIRLKPRKVEDVMERQGR
ncbi:MAG: MCE family protein [Deltaproteobacteria bacterium]|nr:MCE family protein [Deltaproteobacteria bacterium]